MSLLRQRGPHARLYLFTHARRLRCARLAHSTPARANRRAAANRQFASQLSVCRREPQPASPRPIVWKHLLSSPPMQSRRQFLSSLGAMTLASAQTDRPNIVVILMDDLRWDELHCTGHPFALTPNLDRIAAEGVTFRNAFVTSPLCSPSRACFLTGQYAHTHGITDNTDRSPASHRLVTFPALLHRSGYETAFI